MSVRGPQKAIVRKENLPAFSLLKDGTYGYVVRYRIVSEDQNRFSHWSPIYLVRPRYVFLRPDGKAIDEIVIEPNLGYVNIIWDPVELFDQENSAILSTVSEYDVWIRWGIGGNGIWKYRERVVGNSLTLSVPSQYNDTASTIVSQPPEQISVEIYVPGSPITRDVASLLVYKKDLAGL